MNWRPTVLRVPQNARSAATAPKILTLRSRVERPDSHSFQYIQPRPVEARPGERSSLRDTSTPKPQSRPLLSRLKDHGSSHVFSETNSDARQRLPKSNFIERRHPRFDCASSVTSRTGEVNRWHSRKAKESSRKLKSRQPQDDIYIPSTISVEQLAKKLNVRLRTLQRKMDHVGMHDMSSYDHVLTSDYSALLAQEFNRNPIINDENAFDLHSPPLLQNPHLLPTRPPIVAIMGHVDHGKTTLLDNLRSSSIAASEAGGITQHIGAFSVPLSFAGDVSSEGDESSITFLDTPGHAAFSAMRARGVSATDIVVLVVAADDGVMPQTVEIIDLVQREKEATNISMVVAINKVDKPEADVERTKFALLSAGVSLEEHGGDVPCVTVSGLTGSGLPELVETIALVADVMDLRAERDCMPVGYILESKILKGFGPVATVLMTRGTLSPGTPLLAGTSPCSTRRLLSPALQSVPSATPGKPVLVTGWKSLPAAGEEVLAGSESDIKKACANRERERDRRNALGDIEAINAIRQADRERESKERENAPTRRNRTANTVSDDNTASEDKRKHLRVIIKGDVSGSVEALVGAVKDIGNDSAGVKVISTGVGDVSDSDIMMARAADAMIIAFSVGVPRAVQTSASQNHISIYASNIIYRVIDEVRERVISLLPCTYDIKLMGEAKVLQLFEVQIKGSHKKIAGCRVTQGILQRSSSVRVLRGEKTVYEGSVDALRQLKRDVSEVRKGSECGVNLQNFDDLREDDIIQTFETIEVRGEL